MEPRYFVGLDLGQAQDFTALAVLERPPPESAKARGEPPVYSVRHLQRFPLGTPYTAIVREVDRLTAAPPLKGCALVVDSTGVGKAVVDLFREAGLPVWLRSVLITAGHAVNVGDDGTWHVAKKELVSVLQVLLQNRRLKVAQSLPEAQTLAQELQNFRVKVTTAGNETFEAWRDRDHDDLVLAVALAAWWAQRMGTPAVVEAVEVNRDEGVRARLGGLFGTAGGSANRRMWGRS